MWLDHEFERTNNQNKIETKNWNETKTNWCERNERAKQKFVRALNFFALTTGETDQTAKKRQSSMLRVIGK